MINTENLRTVLAAALDADPATPWPRLLELARARTQRLRSLEAHVARESSGVDTGSVDPPIIAALPRRWPQELDVACELFAGGDNLTLRDQLKRLVDGWVLAADPLTSTIEPCD